MVKPKYIVLPLVIILAFVAYWYYWGSSRTPSGQPPLVSLSQSNLDQFKQAFNDAADRTRLVLLVSPT
jgi:hypothetical protein